MKMLKGHKIVPLSLFSTVTPERVRDREHLEGNFHCNFHIHNTDMRFLALSLFFVRKALTLVAERKRSERERNFLLTPRLPRLNEI
jgi:hypothetical protein